MRLLMALCAFMTQRTHTEYSLLLVLIHLSGQRIHHKSQELVGLFMTRVSSRALIRHRELEPS